MVHELMSCYSVLIGTKMNEVILELKVCLSYFQPYSTALKGLYIPGIRASVSSS